MNREALRCPRCAVDLVPEARNGARFDRCRRCRGVAVTAALLRRFAPREQIRALWMNLVVGHGDAPCPSCARPMISTPVDCGGRSIDVDVCKPCQMLWFDVDDLAAFSPARQAPDASPERLSPAAAEALALARIDSERLGEQAEDEARSLAALIRVAAMFIR
jgi:Zn-finger nucleic acid-binding protein